MPGATLKVVISPPTRPKQPGRGFYQLEEDSLYVPIGVYSPERRFFSSIESETVRLDMDKAGELLFIEISLARKKWKVEPSLAPPSHASPADLHWLDFRAEFDNPPVITNSDRSAVCVKFSPEKPAVAYLLAESVIAETTDKLHVCRLWIVDIVDDVGGREIAAFRKAHPAG
jgi:hypothetical protein